MEVLRWARRLSKENFDVAVVSNPMKFFHLVVFLARIPVRVGYRRKWGFLLTKSCADTKSMRDRHESEYNVEIVSLLEGVSSKELHLPQINPSSLPIHPDSEEFVRKVLSEHLTERMDLVAVHPWTTNSKTAWDIDRFIDLINSLLKENLAVLVIGSPEEMVLWSKHKTHVKGTILDLVGKVPLRHLPALLHSCAVLVSNSSGPAHIAAAVGTPTVVVGPDSFKSNSQRWHPLGSNHVTLISPSVDQVVSAVRDRIPPHSPFVNQQCVS